MKTMKTIKTTKIIIVFMVIIIAISGGGYLFYNHQQKATIAQSNSNKSEALNSAKNWKNSSNNISVLSINIFLIHSRMIKYQNSDIDLFNKLDGYYKEIAEYLGTTEKHLDEICSMSQDDSEREITILVRKKY